jgi:hypothetical protein
MWNISIFSSTAKVLFVLSDNESKDGDPANLDEESDHNAAIFLACLLTFEKIFHPRRLYGYSGFTIIQGTA